MTTKPYAELLKDPRWQRRRLETLEQTGFKCEECTAEDKTLHVHHKIYRRGAKPWEYEDRELQVLCEDCHQADHEARSRLNEAVALLDSVRLQMLLGFAEVLAAQAECLEEIPVTSAEQAAGIAAGIAPGYPHDVLELMDVATKTISLDRLWELYAKRRAAEKAVYCASKVN